jgi:hypothetical protein
MEAEEPALLGTAVEQRLVKISKEGKISDLLSM